MSSPPSSSKPSGGCRPAKSGSIRGKTAGVLTQLAMRRKEIDSDKAKIQTLTKREREIVSAVCEGLRNKDISDRMFISEATARNHLTSILDKLGLTSRFDLVVFAFRHGLMKEPMMKQLKQR